MQADTQEEVPLLRASNLVKVFPVESRGLRRTQVGSTCAVDRVSFDIHQGETLGLVGESGSGKSTVARLLTRLEEPTGGAAYLDGEDIFSFGRDRMAQFRRDVQIIFQDPYSSLNPRMTVRSIIQEAWLVHNDVVAPDDREDRTLELLEQVGLDGSALDRYPHEFSGGQRQRIGIARALAVSPRLIICDEPVSALDVSVQAQVLNLLNSLKESLGLSFLFIAHDLAVVRHMSDRLAVMHLGQVVETGPAEKVYETPVHPYTQALLSAIPRMERGGPDEEVTILLDGEMPSAQDPPSGCNFRTRCWKAESRCAAEEPVLDHRGFPHPSACHYPAGLDSALEDYSHARA